MCTINNAEVLVLHLQANQTRKFVNAGVSVAQESRSLIACTAPSPCIRLAEPEHGCTVDSGVAAGSEHATSSSHVYDMSRYHVSPTSIKRKQH
mmetsp:Transcript_66763/g.156504  ORF Transcript_66763/g.156504 Transcript_66763/m.156504 type:complete len:93 (+) Transcript_66763:698-976(+)